MPFVVRGGSCCFPVVRGRGSANLPGPSADTAVSAVTVLCLSFPGGNGVLVGVVAISELRLTKRRRPPRQSRGGAVADVRRPALLFLAHHHGGIRNRHKLFGG